MIGTGMRVAAVAALFAGLTGCGSGKVTVNGTVSYKNKPVTMGTVCLIASDNMQYDGEIKPDGTFTIAGVPTGSVKIGVASLASGPAKPGGRSSGGGGTTGRTGGAPRPEDTPPPAAENPNPVPPEFGDPLKSGLTGVVGKEPLAISVPG